eukprot:COSAG02_NODE_31750_length_528_cov_0.715618_1_plen_46_part_10
MPRHSHTNAPHTGQLFQNQNENQNQHKNPNLTIQWWRVTTKSQGAA